MYLNHFDGHGLLGSVQDVLPLDPLSAILEGNGILFELTLLHETEINAATGRRQAADSGLLDVAWNFRSALGLCCSFKFLDFLFCLDGRLFTDRGRVDIDFGNL